MSKEMDKYYEKHFAELAEQHRKQYEYYKKKSETFAFHAVSETEDQNG